MANFIHTTIRPKQRDRKRTVLGLGTTVGCGWDAKPAPGISQFRIYAHNPTAHYTVGMDRAEAERIVRFLAGTLGFDLAKPDGGNK